MMISGLVAILKTNSNIS